MKRAKGPSSYFSLGSKGSAGGGEKGEGGGGGVDDVEVEDEDNEVEVEVDVTESESSATARAESRLVFGRCSSDRENGAEGLLLEGTEPQRLLLLVGTRRAEEVGVVGESIIDRWKRIQKEKRVKRRLAAAIRINSCALEV